MSWSASAAPTLLICNQIVVLGPILEQRLNHIEDDGGGWEHRDHNPGAAHHLAWPFGRLAPATFESTKVLRVAVPRDDRDARSSSRWAIAEPIRPTPSNPTRTLSWTGLGVHSRVAIVSERPGTAPPRSLHTSYACASRRDSRTRCHHGPRTATTRSSGCSARCRVRPRSGAARPRTATTLATSTTTRPRDGVRRAASGEVLERAGEPLEGFRALFVMNHEDGGFDCPGCAWPDDPNGLRLDICENGVKHATWELRAGEGRPRVLRRPHRQRAGRVERLRPRGGRTARRADELRPGERHVRADLLGGRRSRWSAAPCAGWRARTRRRSTPRGG